MRSHISNTLRQQIIEREQNRCEYCGLAQQGQAATFHIDHIIPVSADGETTADNLALACVGCSLHKAARLTAPDPETGTDVTLYNPRREAWENHFHWKGVQVVGLTATGRATLIALKMNRPIMLSIRAEEQILGRHSHS